MKIEIKLTEDGVYPIINGIAHYEITNIAAEGIETAQDIDDEIFSGKLEFTGVARGAHYTQDGVFVMPYVPESLVKIENGTLTFLRGK